MRKKIKVVNALLRFYQHDVSMLQVKFVYGNHFVKHIPVKTGSSKELSMMLKTLHDSK